MHDVEIVRGMWSCLGMSCTIKKQNVFGITAIVGEMAERGVGTNLTNLETEGQPLQSTYHLLTFSQDLPAWWTILIYVNHPPLLLKLTHHIITFSPEHLRHLLHCRHFFGTFQRRGFQLDQFLAFLRVRLERFQL